MRVFICWLINACDWLGAISFWFMIAMAPILGNAFFLGVLAAIIPAVITAVYAAINYELMLSWAVIRWMSPLNIVTNRIFYFFKVLVLSGALWALIISYSAHKLFPNESFDWALVLFRKFIESILKLINVQ